MARVLLHGEAGRAHMAEVTFSEDKKGGDVLVTCLGPVIPTDEACSWTERYDTLNDATEYAVDHVDGRG